MSEVTRYKKYKKTYQDYYEAHKAKIQQQKRQWNEEHPERLEEYARKYLIQHNERVQKWKQNHPERAKAERLLTHHWEKYPLGNECEFCGSLDNLEHGHIDYDYPELYLTVCHPCNCYMET